MSDLYLVHHGTKGMKWGVRRYQNEDGSYKSGAQGRYDEDGKPGVAKTQRKEAIARGKARLAAMTPAERRAQMARAKAQVMTNASRTSKGLQKAMLDSNARYYTKKADKYQVKVDKQKAKTQRKEAIARGKARLAAMTPAERRAQMARAKAEINRNAAKQTNSAVARAMYESNAEYYAKRAKKYRK